jgi:hypothetical protein
MRAAPASRIRTSLVDAIGFAGCNRDSLAAISSPALRAPRSLPRAIAVRFPAANYEGEI